MSSEIEERMRARSKRRETSTDVQRRMERKGLLVGRGHRTVLLLAAVAFGAKKEDLF